VSPRTQRDDEAALRAEIERLSSALEEREAALSRLGAENRRLAHAIETLSGSRWSRLGTLLKHRPFGAAELGEVLKLGGGMLRTRLGRSAPHAPPAPEASVPDLSPAKPAPPVAPYVVRVPAPCAGRRPRVVHVIANFMTGGSSRLVVDLVEGLGDRYDHRVLTSFVPDPVAFVGVPVAEIKLHAPESAFADYFREAAPDLVHIHYWGSTDEPWYRRAFAAVADLACPVVENVNTPVEPLRSPRIARYVYVSDYVREHFGDDSPSESVIYPGSNLEMFAPAPRRGDDGHTIGMVYRLERDKLDENAIDPLIEAVRQRPGTRALIVGGGTLLPEYRSRVSAAGLDAAFEFTGYVPYEALPAFYDRMTLFVAPVWKESFGQVSTFAMSMGIPVVGYATGAIPEIVRDQALVAPFPDARALAQLIVGLLDDPVRREAIAAGNREFARASFTVEAMVGHYGRMYDELAVRAA